MNTILTTERLRLRAPVTADLDSLVAGIGNLTVSRFLTPVPHPYSRGDGEGWLWSLSGLGPDQVVFAIDLEGEGFIGCIAYEGELGYWIAEPFWGRGFATEAARALLEWKFVNREVMSLGSGVHVDNVASLRVQEKLGSPSSAGGASSRALDRLRSSASTPR